MILPILWTILLTTSCKSTFQLLYESRNLSDYYVSIEPNPGGGTNCGHEVGDVGITKHSDHLEVISNVNKRNVWVNAISGIKWIEQFPNGDPITLSSYKSDGEFRLQVLPKNDINQPKNGEVISSLVQIWDGRGDLMETKSRSLEFAFIWVVNAWSSNYKKFFVYTGEPLSTFDTGLTLTPDLKWHTFSMVVDYESQKYVSLTIDGERADLREADMARVHHEDWSQDRRLALVITGESLSSFPGKDCGTVFTWTTEYRNVKFGKIKMGNESRVDSSLAKRVFYISTTLILLLFFIL